ncbi:MAG TPA: trehalase family glycosidase, partial [Bdellovibrionales bacterium]|nr:trehalase family glycosidase [Bdellovibrionales bacterium]
MYLSRIILTAALGLTQLTSCAHAPSDANGGARTTELAERDASELYGELFERVQLTPVFEDSKHFVDMNPRRDPAVIMSLFKSQAPSSRADLRRFVEAHFDPPANPVSGFKSRRADPLDLHIKRLWAHLKREPSEDVQPASSLIGLPYSYVVPGGRFREIYYWDSYFTMLGLIQDGEGELVQNMVRNFVHLLGTAGRIPNGNRDYYRGRSQPPFFSHMVALWQSEYGTGQAVQFLPALLKEYDFWMSGARAV